MRNCSVLWWLLCTHAEAGHLPNEMCRKSLAVVQYSVVPKCFHFQSVISVYLPTNRYSCNISQQKRTTFILPQAGWDDMWKTTERARRQNSWRVWRDIDNKAGRSVFVMFFLFSSINNSFKGSWLMGQKCLIPPKEQYDAFVKFTHDQLLRRFGEQPASCKFTIVNPGK